jgi:gamma-glutamylcyclotransferase (GGCT)/AIG2-like uncharacterized protein YtfP
MCRIFAYGTLQPGEYYYPNYCAGAVSHQPAIAYGSLYDLPIGYPAMIPGDRPVQGTLLIFPTPDILPVLDELEGYSPARSPQDNVYIRRAAPVFDRDLRPLGQAWMYWMTAAQVRELGGVLCESNGWRSAQSPFVYAPPENDPLKDDAHE